MTLPDDLWAELEVAHDAPRDHLEDFVEIFDGLPMPYEHFGRDGEPISAGEAMLLVGLDEYRQVGDDTVGNLRISTVWLGWTYSGHLFETLVFKDGSAIEDGRRYHTEQEAIEGHRRTVETCASCQAWTAEP